MNRKPGRTVLDLMLNPNEPPVFIANVQAPEGVEQHPEWSSHPSYASFAAAAIRRAEPKLHGMVTLDSPNPGVLVKEDADILAIVARLVAAGYQAAERATPPENRSD
ncbi:hypothetical protein OHN37_39720 [Streptomyces sp. NBC_00485]|uniref:hypothetical protein n=1 Tax=Streptomyces sp. NBC_00485 TaxID=2975758 RepID=UPI002E19D455